MIFRRIEVIDARESRERGNKRSIALQDFSFPFPGAVLHLQPFLYLAFLEQRGQQGSFLKRPSPHFLSFLFSF